MTLCLPVIVGPTASGKTQLGVQLAHHIGAEIISADSRQVYIGLDIGTGKDLHEYTAVDPTVRHHLIDVVEPHEVYSLFDYQQSCFALIRKKACAQSDLDGQIPFVLVGGSGLYVEAVVRDYRIADVPANPVLRELLSREPHEALVDWLRTESPHLVDSTDLSSTKRVIRALEIAAAERDGPVTYSEPLGLNVVFRVFGVRIDRGDLAARIEERLASRMADGLVEEVSGLIESGVDPDRLEMLGMEYRQVAAHLLGDKSYEQMLADLCADIRHLAKRQETYFRGMEKRGTPIEWIGPGDLESLLNALGRA
ncbi:MAG: tRNA (adenosine(37)-N6)-dimethylallyltransferase MiaA [bacterium]|nr:tRNA (adenosine(37)-N6)-dimethylallyltransferase MiaA [bacterium]